MAWTKAQLTEQRDYATKAAIARVETFPNSRIDEVGMNETLIRDIASQYTPGMLKAERVAYVETFVDEWALRAIAQLVPPSKRK